MNRATRWSLLVFLLAVAQAAASQAQARPCPPCVDSLCVDDEPARSAYADKRARLLASGAPQRLVDSLLARTARCEYCLRTLPDALHILLEYPNGTRWSFAYSRFDEKLAREELRSGRIKAFHVFIASDPCTCCGQLAPRQDPVTGLVTGETDSFTSPGQLGADPRDLTDVGQPPPYEFPPDLPHPPKTETCPACVAAAAQRDQAAEAAWFAEHTFRRHKAEQEWDYRRATYALDRGDLKAAGQATRAARDWQVKVDQANAGLALARAALERADTALRECEKRCPAAIPPPPPAIPWRPSGSLDLRLGPSLVLKAPGDHQMAIALQLRLRVLPRERPGYLTLQPFVALFGGITTVGLPLGFEYDHEIARSGVFVYGRLGIGYVGRIIPLGSGTTRLDSALILPEAGLRYELRWRPLHVGVDLFGLPLYVGKAGVDVSYRMMAYVGYLFGR